jgi:hypothetical protein
MPKSIPIPNFGLTVKTWVECDDDPDISDLSDPFPANIRHCIKIISTAGYARDFDVHGFIAAGYSQLAYHFPGAASSSQSWNKPISQVIIDGKELCTMKVDPGTVIARIQASNVEIRYRFGVPSVRVLPRPLELSIQVS